MVYSLIFGYLTALTISFVKWRGFQLAVKKHANLLLVLLLLSVLFVYLGGAEFLVGVIGFSLFVAVILTMIAGPFGCVLGCVFGLGVGIISAFYHIIP